MLDLGSCSDSGVKTETQTTEYPELEGTQSTTRSCISRKALYSSLAQQSSFQSSSMFLQRFLRWEHGNKRYPGSAIPLQITNCLFKTQRRSTGGARAAPQVVWVSLAELSCQQCWVWEFCAAPTQPEPPAQPKHLPWSQRAQSCRSPQQTPAGFWFVLSLFGQYGRSWAQRDRIWGNHSRVNVRHGRIRIQGGILGIGGF